MVNDSLELDNLSAVAFELENSQCLYKLCVGSTALELGAISELNVAGSSADAVIFKAAHSGAGGQQSSVSPTLIRRRAEVLAGVYM